MYDGVCDGVYIIILCMNKLQIANHSVYLVCHYGWDFDCCRPVGKGGAGKYM